MNDPIPAEIDDWSFFAHVTHGRFIDWKYPILPSNEE